MASSFPGTMNRAGVLFPTQSQTVRYNKVYNEHCHRIYSLAFWMTDNELAAEQLATNTFLRVFAGAGPAGSEQIDKAFLAEIRSAMPLGSLTLDTTAEPETKSVRGNVKRIELERAVVQLPATEKLIFLLHDVEGYEHLKISRLLGITGDESRFGLHQARLRIRQLVLQSS